jgi:DnaJ-domain-containing protein 1
MSLPRRLWRLARHSVRGIPSIPTFTFDAREAGHPQREAERELEEFLGTAAEAPPTPPPHPMTQQYVTLGVPVGADAATVEKAWRRLVLKNHPDRFADDPAAERAANERLRRINEAHDQVIRWIHDQDRA